MPNLAAIWRANWARLWRESDETDLSEAVSPRQHGCIVGHNGLDGGEDPPSRLLARLITAFPKSTVLALNLHSVVDL